MSNIEPIKDRSAKELKNDKKKDLKKYFAVDINKDKKKEKKTKIIFKDVITRANSEKLTKEEKTVRKEERPHNKPSRRDSKPFNKKDRYESKNNQKKTNNRDKNFKRDKPEDRENLKRFKANYSDRSDNRNSSKDRNNLRNSSDKKVSSPLDTFTFEKYKPTQEEQDILNRGSLLDRINLISLICLKEPSNDNFKKLLSFSENQRADVIYYTLKNIKDLLLNIDLEEIDSYIRGRIIKTLEIQSKNKFIGNKVLVLIENILNGEVYSDDMIYILVNALNVYKSKFLIQNINRFSEQLIVALEDYYHKNDTFRAQNNALKFIEGKKIPGLFDFYNGLSVDREYQENERIVMYERIINGLYLNYKENDTVRLSILNYINTYTGENSNLIESSLGLLQATDNKYMRLFVLKHTTKFTRRGGVGLIVELEKYVRKVKQSAVVTDKKDSNKKKSDSSEKKGADKKGIIHEESVGEFLGKVLSNSFPLNPAVIMALIMLCYKEKNIPWSIYLFRFHYDRNVRKLAQRVIEGQEIEMFDPFDSLALELQE